MVVEEQPLVKVLLQRFQRPRPGGPSPLVEPRFGYASAPFHQLAFTILFLVWEEG